MLESRGWLEPAGAFKAALGCKYQAYMNPRIPPSSPRKVGEERKMAGKQTLLYSSKCYRWLGGGVMDSRGDSAAMVIPVA